jgi:hypothetical protein
MYVPHALELRIERVLLARLRRQFGGPVPKDLCRPTLSPSSLRLSIPFGVHDAVRYEERGGRSNPRADKRRATHIMAISRVFMRAVNRVNSFP